MQMYAAQDVSQDFVDWSLWLLPRELPRDAKPRGLCHAAHLLRRLFVAIVCSKLFEG